MTILVDASGVETVKLVSASGGAGGCNAGSKPLHLLYTTLTYSIYEGCRSVKRHLGTDKSLDCIYDRIPTFQDNWMLKPTIK